MKEEQQIDMVLSALANQVRRNVIHTLALQPRTVTALAMQESISLPAMHKHLALLEKADIIRRQKVGRTNFVALNPDSLQVVKTWINRYQAHWGSRDATLQNYISKLNSTPRNNTAGKG